MIQAVLHPRTWVLFDMGYTNFAVFRQLSEQGVTFLTRAKTKLAYEVEQVFQRRAAVHDRLVWIGQAETRQRVRLIEVLYKGTWYRYLTNEVDPLILPIEYSVTLYWQRWRIEDAYNRVKRLLGWAYFWSGSQNAVELQVWATWLLYAVLVDLTDILAQALNRPFSEISLEMVYRSLYYLTKAHERGAAQDLISYLVQNTKLLGLVKRKPPPSKLGSLFDLTAASIP